MVASPIAEPLSVAWADKKTEEFLCGIWCASGSLQARASRLTFSFDTNVGYLRSEL